MLSNKNLFEVKQEAEKAWKVLVNSFGLHSSDGDVVALRGLLDVLPT